MYLTNTLYSNIDRLFAIWQALNPTKWLDNIPPDNATVTDSHGTQHAVNEDTPLEPFRQSADGSYWTPTGVRHTSTLGYSYPELQRWDSKYLQSDGAFNDSVFQADLNATINKLYGVSRSLALDPKAPTPDGVEQIDGGLQIKDFGFSIRFLK